LIITFNLKDFPDAALSAYNLKAQHPDDFIYDLFDLNQAAVLQAAAAQRASLRNPPKSQEEYLEVLLQQGLTQTVGVMQEWIRIL
jgi:hypothetical protein